MKKLFKLILNLAIGSFFGLLLAVIFFTLSEFAAVDLHVTESNDTYFALSSLASMLIFIGTVIVWLKYKSKPTFILMILIVGGLYTFGKIYSHKIIRPFQIANKYSSEATTIYKKWSGKGLTTANSQNYLTDQKRGLELLKKSTKLNFGYETWIKKYHQNAYELRKEMYEMDRKLISGELVMTNDQMTKLIDVYNKKIQENFYISPFWMGFYGVDPMSY